MVGTYLIVVSSMYPGKYGAPASRGEMNSMLLVESSLVCIASLRMLCSLVVARHDVGGIPF